MELFGGSYVEEWCQRSRCACVQRELEICTRRPDKYLSNIRERNIRRTLKHRSGILRRESIVHTRRTVDVEEDTGLRSAEYGDAYFNL